MSPSLSQAETTKSSNSFILPDLVSHCKFPLTYNVHGDEVAKASTDWMDANCPDLTPKQRRALRGLQAGELTAYTYTAASPERLRVVADFLTYLFHLDNISDGMMTRETDVLSDVVMNALWFTDKYMPTNCPGKEQPKVELNPGKLARDFWGRGLPNCGPGANARFMETFELFFEAVSVQAKAREQKFVPDLESYIDIRRDTSGCKPCWALIEYALDIDLPDFVIEHPIIEALGQNTNDLVTWSNDIFSYNKEQSQGDGTHNMICILMTHHGHTLQSAVDYVGDLCASTIDTFTANKEQLPSWGPEIDSMVAGYVQGLQDWIVGSLHWSYQTHRYFGTKGMEVKRHRIVELLPVEKEDSPVEEDSELPPSESLTSMKPETSLTSKFLFGEKGLFILLAWLYAFSPLIPSTIALRVYVYSAFITMTVYILSIIFDLHLSFNSYVRIFGRL